MTTIHILGAFFILFGLLMFGQGIPLMRRKIKPNGWYGFREGEIRQNWELWYQVNAYFGRLQSICGALLVTLASVLLLIPDMAELIYTFINTIAFGISAYMMTLLTRRYMRRVSTKRWR